MPEIHPRIFRRHPQLNEEDIRTAWRNSYYEALRADSQNYPEYLWIGVDSKGRDVEMVGTLTDDGWLIYHANTPLSRRVRLEVEKARREVVWPSTS